MNDESKVIKMLDVEENQNILQAQPQSEYEEQQMLQEPGDNTTNKTFINVKDNIKRIKDDGALGTIENTYRTIFENYAVAITLVDEQERIISWNKYAEELLGVNENDLYLVPVSTLYPAEEWQRMRKENIRQKGIKYRMETRMIKKDKKTFDVEISICVLKSEKGKTVGSVGIIKDITKQKEMERALEKSEKKFKQLYEKAPVPYHTLSPSGVITDVNEIWCQLLGYSKDEVVGKPIFDFVHETEREAAKASFEKKIQSKITYSQSNERAYISKTGEKRFFVIRDFFSLDENNDVTTIYTVMNDITELTKAREQLEKYERHLEKLIEERTADITHINEQLQHEIIERNKAEDEKDNILNTSQDLICIAGMDGYFKYVNPAWEKILGYTTNELLSKPFLLFIHPDDHEKNNVEVNKLAEGKNSFNFENRYIHKDSSIRWISWKATPRLEQKQMYCVGRDITERKQMEDALRGNEEKFKLLFNDSPAGIALVDQKGIVKEVNKSLLQLLPIRKEEFIGKNFIQLASSFGLDTKEYISDFQNRIAGESPIREITFLSKDNRQVTISVQSSVIKSGDEILGILFILQDITERKKAEQLLKESEEKFRTIFDSATDGILIADMENKKFLTGNNTICSMLGYGMEEIKNLGVMEIHPKEDLPFVVEQFEKQVRKEIFLAKNIPMKRKDDSIFYADINSAPITLSGKTYLMGSFRDITERKNAEEEINYLKEYNENILESNPNPMMVVKGQRIEYVNKSFVSTFGETKNEYIKRNLKDVLPSEILPVFENLLQECGKSTELRFGGKDFSVYPFVVKKAEEEEEEEEVRTGILFQDITEHKKAEEALRKKEERFKAIFNTTFQFTGLMTLDGILTEANQSAVDFTGLKLEDVINRPFWETHWWRGNEERVKKLKESIRLAASGTFIRYEVELQGSGDTTAIFDFSIKPAFGPDGKVAMLVPEGRDITERKQVEDTLRVKDWVIESTINAIAISDLQGNLTYVNPAFLKLWGYSSSAEVLGKSATEFWQMGEKAAEVIDALSTRGGWIGELVARGKNGVLFKVQVSASMTVDATGKPVCMQASFADITERKQAEEEREKILLWQQGVNTLQLSLLVPAPLEDKLKMITDSVVRLFDADFCRIWITQPGDLCEKGCIHAEAHEGPHVCQYRDRCLRLRASSGRYTHTDGKIHRRVPFGCYKIGRVASGEDHKFLTNDVQNDSHVHNNDWARELGLVSFAGYQLRVPGGETIGVLALFAKHPIMPAEDTMLDGLSSTIARITQQAISEDSLRESTRKIEMQNVQLKKLDKIKSDFLNITSHELRTPMSAIKGYTQMVFKQKLGQVTDEQRQALNVVLRNTDRLDNLIRDILDISRLESGTMKFVPEKTNPGKMVKEAIETMQPTAELKNIKISNEIENDIPEMMVDPERIKQVIINIVNNAIKFSPNGTIINVRTKKEKDQVLFEIQDFGRGIPKDKQEKIFEIFYQVDSGMDRKFGGAGLGLAISRGIILSHGGKIWVESEPDKGSTFRFALPITPVQDLEGKFRDVDIFKLKDTKRAIENDLRDKTIVWDEPGEKRGEKT